jgi:peptidyl-prolyl cis-trans isomerase SurA
MFNRPSFFALFLLVSLSLRAGEVLDRIAATVNGHVILQSDWDDELRYECFMSGRKLSDATSAERQPALDRLIDQEILREQMHATDVKPAGAEQIEKQIELLKSDELREHASESWENTLTQYQLTEKVVESHVAAELEQFQLIDTRFRPSIQISAAEIEKYYREQLVPKLPASESVSLADSTPKIREILIQDKMNQLLSSWLEALRSQAQIRITSENPTADTKTSDGGAQ